MERLALVDSCGSRCHLLCTAKLTHGWNDRGIDLAKIAEKLPGASGAEIKAVCTESGMYALRERRVHVTQEDFEMSVAKVWHVEEVAR